MISIREIRSRDELPDLEGDWRALEAVGGARTVFQTWAWNSAWLEGPGRSASLRFLVFTDWRRPVAIAPLVIRKAYGLPFRRMQWSGTGVSDYLEPIVAPEHANAVLPLLETQLAASSPRDGDVLDLHQARHDTPLLTRFAGRSIEQAVAPYRPLPESIDELHRQIGKKLRSNLRYAQRVLERDRSVEFRLANSDTLGRDMDGFFRLHALRWRSKRQRGVLAGRLIQEFHRAAASRLLDQGALRLHSLDVDGRIVASIYCFIHGGVTSYYLGGFAPDFSRTSVGTLLTARALETAGRMK